LSNRLNKGKKVKNTPVLEDSRDIPVLLSIASEGKEMAVDSRMIRARSSYDKFPG